MQWETTIKRDAERCDGNCGPCMLGGKWEWGIGCELDENCVGVCPKYLNTVACACQMESITFGSELQP